MVALGKAPAALDSRTLALGRYLQTAALPPIPASCGWADGRDWDSRGNDEYSDCVQAGACHIEDVFSVMRRGQLSGISTQTVLDVWQATTGGRVGQPPGPGTVMLEFLKYWRTTGIGGHRILAFVSVDWRNPQQVAAAIYLFGAVFCGVLLPDTARRQWEQRAWWQVGGSGDSRPGSWGPNPRLDSGHAFPISDYRDGWYWPVTWGQLWPTTADFIRTYTDEMYAVLGPEWAGADRAPNGVDLPQLLDDLAVVTA